MSLVEHLSKHVGIALLVAGVGVPVWQLVQPNATPKPYTVNVTEPKLSGIGLTGRALFEVNCAPCHGLKAAGAEKGPPLVHDIYNPGHHSTSHVGPGYGHIRRLAHNQPHAAFNVRSPRACREVHRA